MTAQGEGSGIRPVADAGYSAHFGSSRPGPFFSLYVLYIHVEMQRAKRHALYTGFFEVLDLGRGHVVSTKAVEIEADGNGFSSRLKPTPQRKQLSI